MLVSLNFSIFFYFTLLSCLFFILFFFFNDPATTEIYTYWHTLALHDALPICKIRDARLAQAHDEADLAGGEAHVRAFTIWRRVWSWVRSRCSGVTAMAPRITAARSVSGSTESSLAKSPIHR